jgi:hypothetical protein
MAFQHRGPRKPTAATAHEPSIADLLSGSVVQAVMQADGVDPYEFVAMLRRLAAIRARWREQPET